MKNTDISLYLKDRPEQLKRAKEEGVKIIATLPGNYVPEEIIYASGAIPICLIHGGVSSADAGLDMIPDIMCPFSRAQIGERMLKNPYYNVIDMLVAPITCQHIKKIAEVWEFNPDMDIFKLGIPHQYDKDFGLEYYTERLIALKERLEDVTGNEITDERLEEAIDLYNKMRGLLKNISFLRKSYNPPMNSREFISLNHTSFYADPRFMVDYLENIYHDLKNNTQNNDHNDKVKILLLGPNLAYGDSKIFELIESSGAEIVIEEICEGVRYYWDDIEKKGDPIRSLAKGYLRDRLPCAFMRNSAKKRLDFTINLINEFNAHGVIWYELIGCETYDSESYFFEQRLRKQGIPMITVESDYSASDLGQIGVRVEAFIEQIKGV